MGNNAPETEKPRIFMNQNKKRARRSPEPGADTPAGIKRKINRGFDLAEQERKDHKRVKHPTKKNLTLVDASPLLPDLEAFPDSGAFITIKFSNNPVPSSGEYDKRLLNSIFRPLERTQLEEAAYEEALQAHQADPKNIAKPSNLMNYEFFLPQDKKTATNFRSMFDVDNPDREDEGLYTHNSGSGGCFPFSRVRAYETAQETELEHAEKYSNEILLAHHDEDKYPRQKAVYYYPVLQKSVIRPQRTKNIARTIGAGMDEDETIVERMDVTIEDPSEAQLDAMRRYKEQPFGQHEEEEEQQEEEETQPQRERGEDAEGEDDVQRDRDSSAGRRSKSRDAEGEDEDED